MSEKGRKTLSRLWTIPDCDMKEDKATLSYHAGSKIEKKIKSGALKRHTFCKWWTRYETMTAHV